MRINVLRASGDDASYRLRLHNPAALMISAGATGVQICGPDDPVVDPDGLPDAVVINRPHDERAVLLIEELESVGIAVVVDIDDDFGRIPANHGGAEHAPARHKLLLRAVKAASLTVVSTPALTDVYNDGRTVVVPNYLPVRFGQYGAKELRAAPLWVGWAGTRPNHANDMAVAGPGAGKAMAAAGAELALVGTGRGADAAQLARDVGHKRPPLVTGLFNEAGYYRAISQLDVGLAPLADTLFSEAKSWLKGYEYALMGVPFVASPTQAYQELAGYGAGLLTHRRDESTWWRRHLSALLADEGLRTELSLAGYRAVAKLALEDHLDEYWEAWTGQSGSVGASRDRLVTQTSL